MAPPQLARRFQFSLRCTLICGLLALCMLRASHWQWQRHQWKLGYIATLENRFTQEPLAIDAIVNQLSETPQDFIHRRVWIKGQWDFSQETVLRNRRYKEMPGVHVITPLLLEGSKQHILVNRGFIPLHLAEREQRSQFHKPESAEFLGLLKASTPRRWLGPTDPPAGNGNPWVDAWLWLDVNHIQQQLPYPVLPLTLEILAAETSLADAREQIVSSASGRDELFFLPSKQNVVRSAENAEKLDYPVPVFDTVTPPGRHLGYVYEWAVMALATILIGLVLQLRRPEFRG